MYKISEDSRKKLRGEIKVLYTLLKNSKTEEPKEKYLTALYNCKLSLYLINHIIDDEIKIVKRKEKGEQNVRELNSYLRELKSEI